MCFSYSCIWSHTLKLAFVLYMCIYIYIYIYMYIYFSLSSLSLSLSLCVCVCVRACACVCEFMDQTKFPQKEYFRSKKNRKCEHHHWILHIRISLGAIFVGAIFVNVMTLLGQSRESWRSIAPVGHERNSQTKMLWHF